MKKIKLIDVTDEYLNRKMNKGQFIIEEGYNKSCHINEVKMAKWIYSTFGGDITVLVETENVYKGKRADYLWNDCYWELKNTGSAKAVDSALRKGLQQINEKPGGIILDLGKCKDSISRIESVIKERIRKSCRFSIDIIIVHHHSFEKVLRYTYKK